MTIPDLVKLAQARLTNLNGQRADAVSVGSTEAIERLDCEIVETESTLEALKTLV